MIGIVIVNYCTWEATKKCVASIKDNCEMPYRVYIVDNDSPNDSMMQLRAFYANDETVKLFSSGKNGGYGYGLNYGIDKAIRDDCDAVIASNNDIHYMPGAISNMYD